MIFSKIQLNPQAAQSLPAYRKLQHAFFAMCLILRAFTHDALGVSQS